jgi:hypothetical protein
MAAPTTSRRRTRHARSYATLVHKPNGVIHPRVQAVGPEHFAIVSVDPAKDSSRWMMADFYGKILVAPTELKHDAAALRGAIEVINRVRKACSIHDMIVVVERTGKFHHPAKRAFAAAGFEVRIVHPHSTKQFRQPAHPDCKTDDTDLAGRTRGTFLVIAGLCEMSVISSTLAPRRAWQPANRGLRGF